MLFVGSSCDDGDGLTLNDVVGDDCNCSGVIGVSVTFTVDMNLISQVSDQGVYIAGTFQGWDAETTMLQTTEMVPGVQLLMFHLDIMNSSSSTVGVEWW